MTSSPRSAVLVLAGVFGLGAVALLAIGFVAGRYSVVRDFDRAFDEVEEARTLGHMLDSSERRSVVGAYYDDEGILGSFDDISWAVRNVPTPFVGSAPMPGRHHNAVINSSQFRNEKEVEVPKPPKRFRIFLTGGSTAFGSGAPDQQRTIAGYLERILNEALSPTTDREYEVFVAANPAWATTHERILIENKLSDLEPDLLIAFSGNNDVHWGFLGRNSMWFRSYADEFFFDLVRQVFAFRNKAEIPDVTQTAETPIPAPLVAARLAKNVRLGAFALAGEGVDYLFVLQPTLAVTRKKLSEREAETIKVEAQPYFRDCYIEIDRALNSLRADNFDYVDLSGVFDSVDSREEVFIDSYHFGDRGNEVIARKIFERIRENAAR